MEFEKKLRCSLTNYDQAIPEIRELLFSGISGYPDVKLSLMCLLANPWDSAGSRERIHILLYGKPGCGKTALMEPLEAHWNALYLSMDPSGASLKGDGRREDHGVKILNQYDGGIICVDDIECMKDINVFRDVMEKGQYTMTKNGTHSEYDAHCRIIAATNAIEKVPKPIISRFDLIHKFDAPTVDQSMDILRSMLKKADDQVDPWGFLQYYYYLVHKHEPQITAESEIQDIFKQFFDAYGQPLIKSSEKEGKEGRWIAGVLRIAKALARLQLTDIGPYQISQSLEMKHKSDLIAMELKC